ncbi:hypothetical protein CTI12_AA208220 [Artemisia annua]|uniref:Uncharacterized protein n=1 Tax=Artemisia annua TaxID=35608 RepID=A0A2U1P0C5_ARTAN|nr:hypothetical protein CTI12_AA208220 [Artemisia annua]
MSKEMKEAPFKEVEKQGVVTESFNETYDEAVEETGNEIYADAFYDYFNDDQERHGTVDGDEYINEEHELNAIYADAFYEYVNGDQYVNEEHERLMRQDEEALMELLAEEERAEREMNEKLKQERDLEEFLWKIDYGIAEPEDFGNYRYETNWDVLLNLLKGPIH